MLIGEAPGEQEDKAGIPWVGKAGTLMRGMLAAAGIDECWVTNALKHRPPQNKTPNKTEIKNCLGFLYQEWCLVKPKLVILAGKTAETAFDLMIEDFMTLEDWEVEAEVHRIYHPSYVQRPQGLRKRAEWEARIMEIGERYRALGGVSYGTRAEPVKIEARPEPESWFIKNWWPGERPEFLAVDTETEDGEKDWHPKKVVFVTMSDGKYASHAEHIYFNRVPHHAYYHNSKYDLPLLGGDLDDLSSWDDTMLMAYVLREPEVGLKAVGPKYTGLAMTDYAETVTVTETNDKGKEKKRRLTFSELLAHDPDRAIHYACLDAVVTSRLARIFSEKLKTRPSLWRYYVDFEKPVTPLLHKMEAGGIRIDVPRLEIAGERMRVEMDVLAEDIRVLTNRGIENPSSPRQVAAYLLDHGCPLKETKTGLPSADEATLQRIERMQGINRQVQVLAGKILDYRKLVKMKGTYVDKLPDIVDDRGFAHARFNQTATATNRLSSSDPINFQNIPGESSGKYGELIRGAFIPDSPDHVWLKADFSQLELRIFRHYTHDPVLTEAYCGDTERDVHQLIADRLGIARPQAKNGIFATLYGVAQAKLAQTFGVREDQAAAFLETIRKEMPSLLEWPRTVESWLVEKQGIETWFGWWMPFPQYASPVWSERQEALRQAMNGPIQGTASGVVKKLMRMVNEELRPGGYLQEERCLLQVHDELGFSVPQRRLAEVTSVLTRMGREAGSGLAVPLRLDCKAGKNWFAVEGAH